MGGEGNIVAKQIEPENRNRKLLNIIDMIVVKRLRGTFSHAQCVHHHWRLDGWMNLDAAIDDGAPVDVLAPLDDVLVALPRCMY